MINMTPDQSRIDAILKELGPKLTNAFTDFKFLTQVGCCFEFQAQSIRTKEKITIRILDRTPNFCTKNEALDTATTLFIQELLHRCTKFGNKSGILTESFEYSQNKIAVAIKTDSNVKVMNQSKDVPISSANLDKMIEGVISDIKFLRSNLELENFKLHSKNIFYNLNADAFFLNDWCSQVSNSNPKVDLKQSFVRLEGVVAEDLQELGLMILEMWGIQRKELDEFMKTDEGGNQRNELSKGLLEVFDKIYFNSEIKSLIINSLHKAIRRSDEQFSNKTFGLTAYGEI